MRELDSYASSGLIVHRGVVFVAGCRTLYCLDAKTGGINWTFTPQRAKGEWIYLNPVLKAGRVLIGDRCGNLNCLDAKTGKMFWRRQLSRGDNNDVNSTAIIIRDTVVSANNQGKVLGFDFSSGKTLWRQQVDGAVTDELLRIGNRVIVAANSLFEIDSRSGSVVRKTSYQGKRVASVTVAGKRVVATLAADFPSIAAAWNDPSAFNGQLVFLANGRETARVDVQGTPDLRTCTESGLIFAANHYGFRVFDASSGMLLQSRDDHWALPSYANGKFYGLAEDGVVFSEAVNFATPVE
jgi:outer membrane protein assembly factor BamB